MSRMEYLLSRPGLEILDRLEVPAAGLTASLRNYLKTRWRHPTDEAFDTTANHTRVESSQDN